MLVEVSKESFLNVVKNKCVRTGQGNLFHSTNYYDINDNIVAVETSSSYTNEIRYEIEVENENELTVNFISGLINKY